MAKPVFVLIPGSFSPAAIYDKVLPHFKKAGYEAHALSLPSVGERVEGPATMQDDAASIHTAISNLVKSGKEAIVMMNSYGAFPGTEACNGLAKSEGGIGGVVALVYVAAYLPAVGMSVKDTWGGWTPDEVKRGDPYMTLNPSDNHHLNIFSDVPEPEAKLNMSIFSPHSCVSWMGNLTYPAYKYIPTTYVIPTDDRIIPTEYQKSMLAAAQKDGAEGIKVLSLETGHAPMLTAPEAVAEILIVVAKGVEDDLSSGHLGPLTTL